VNEASSLVAVPSNPFILVLLGHLWTADKWQDCSWATQHIWI